jgi:DNA-binding NtrC family response regulator
MNKTSILIVDDDQTYLAIMQELFHEEGYEKVIAVNNPENVPDILTKNDVDLIITDLNMPEMSGLELLEIISQTHPQIPVIMVTGIDDIDTALKAIKLGAYYYITKPPDTDLLFLTIKRALEQRLLQQERDSLRSALTNQTGIKEGFEDIITNSPVMHKIFELVEIFAPTNETVLIVGETGTGKDLIAKKIHDISARKNKPFVVVNLASISPSLFESELFGHERGSFTGATSEKAGYFEAANGGTIFLDEIGELPKELQGKLLRTIQYGEIYRIGNPKPIKLDIRIIAATNRDLVEDVNNKDFRADLYYRLNRGFIQLPPLRTRGADIHLLADHFLKIGNRTYSKNVKGFSSEISNLLQNYNFPGNIREMENIILNAVAKTKNNEMIDDLDISKNLLQNDENIEENVKLISLEQAEENHIKNIMNYMEGSVRKAAYVLGVSERTLQRKLQRMRNN